jgi:carbamate kinase
LEIVEKNIFQNILEAGFIAIGGGGGGIPVTRNSSGELNGVEAVIDKDRTSALLANEVGVEQLVILTGVDFAYLNFKGSRPQPIKNITVDKMESYLEQGEFLEGSMKPKVQAAIEFIQKGGQKAIIANLYDLLSAMEGQTGTHISA